jgi:hypothetical protein
MNVDRGNFVTSTSLHQHLGSTSYSLHVHPMKDNVAGNGCHGISVASVASVASLTSLGIDR